MSESPISELSKKDPLRNAVAKQLQKARNIGKESLYPTDRDSIGYAEQLSGVKHLFDYVRDLGTNNFILDIGAGEALGINELSQSSLGKGLRFEATALRINPRTADNKGDVKIHAVPVETLHGISDRSVGGIIKATFDTDGKDILGVKTYTEFRQALQKLGYDIAIDRSNLITGSHDILLAIKSGGKREISAAELLQADKESASQQMELLTKEKKATTIAAVR